MSAENWNELRQSDDPPLPPRPKAFGGTREIRFAPSGAPRTPLNLGSDEAMSLAAASTALVVASFAVEAPCVGAEVPPRSKYPRLDASPTPGGVAP